MPHGLLSTLMKVAGQTKLWTIKSRTGQWTGHELAEYSLRSTRGLDNFQTGQFSDNLVNSRGQNQHNSIEHEYNR